MACHSLKKEHIYCVYDPIVKSNKTIAIIMLRSVYHCIKLLTLLFRHTLSTLYEHVQRHNKVVFHRVLTLLRRSCYWLGSRVPRLILTHFVQTADFEWYFRDVIACTKMSRAGFFTDYPCPATNV